MVISKESVHATFWNKTMEKTRWSGVPVRSLLSVSIFSAFTGVPMVALPGAAATEDLP